ncbi:hypothetical protein F5X97DRAFT_333248 [Nemania serpens]|nr:hypothetical protein F5X97DRAFT_333248 [Nemania serpens]
MTTLEVLQPADATAVTSGIKHYGSKDTASRTDRPSTSTKLPARPEQNETVDDEPFTTITMVPDTETPPPPITTSFTTSTTVEGGSYVVVTVATTIVATTIVGHIKAADPLTEYVATTTYGNGTVSTISKNVYDRVLTYTDFDSAGKPTKTTYVHVLNSAQITTLRDPFGYPTATLDYYDVELTTTLYNDNNVPTATRTTIVPETPSPSTMYDSNGVPIWTQVLLRPISRYSQIIATASPTSPPSSNEQQSLELRRMPDGIYFVGLMLPTLFAILVFIPIRILHQNVKLYQGFHALASDRGASAAESICMKTTGPTSLLNGLWSLRRGNYLLALTSALVILSALTIPFSAEVSRLVLQGPQCHPHEKGKSVCSVVLGVFPTTARVLSVLFIVLIVGIAAAALRLRRWETGVERNPWSISYMAQLAANDDVRRVFQRCRRYGNASKGPSTKEFVIKLRGKILGLREWEENHVMKYSVLVLTQEIDDGMDEKPVNKASQSVKFSVNSKGVDSNPFFMLSLMGRIFFLVLLGGVLVAVITYNIVARGSEYERGLTGKAVGARFLFSGAGVLISFTWGSFFHAVAFLSPYKLLYRKRLNKGEGFNLNPATNPFTGLWLAFVPSRRDVYLGVVAATAILSEALPLYLGNIPCNGVQLQSMEAACVYLSVAILSVMILVVGGSFFVNWPQTMGADPSTIVGAMYAAHVFSVEQPRGRFFKKETSALV